MTMLLDVLCMQAGSILNVWMTMQLQTAAFVVLLLLVERALPARWSTPRLRYLLWTTVLLKALLPPVVAFPGTSALSMPLVLLAPVEVLAGATASSGTATLITAEIIILFIFIAASLILAGIAFSRALSLRRVLRDATPYAVLPAGDWPPVFVSDRIPTPLATGIRAPRIYITPAIAAAPRDILLAVLQHERAHIRRRDGIVVVMQTLVQIAYALNPLVWMANLRLFRYRELICDEEALAATGTRPSDYGRLLIGYAEAQPARLLQTGTCFFETRRGFVQRISELFNAQERPAMKWKHYIPIVLVALIILPLSWRCDHQEITYTETLTRPSGNASDGDRKASGPVAAPDYPVKSTMTYEKTDTLRQMSGPRIEGGLAALQAQIKYPEAAMRRKIEGMVVVEATITEDGPASALRVRKSVHPDLDAAALQAVKAVRFAAGYRNGKVIESTIAIPISFKLQ
ncbi:MAG: M56 family metallopeptidase [Bacteroidota bacterium]|jgi:TonB family protein|nr:M56 family metallopeptidase [Bacteroidota bacterium]